MLGLQLHMTIAMLCVDKYLYLQQKNNKQITGAFPIL